MVKLQIISDAHAEFQDDKYNPIIPSADILILAGDICCCSAEKDFDRYKRFIMQYIDNFSYILLVAGNHEYYTSKPSDRKNPTAWMDSVNKKIEIFAKSHKKLVFLNNSVFKLAVGKKKYHFIGTTLWSWVKPEDRKEAQSRMNDYMRIYKSETEKFSIEDMCKLFSKNLSFIKRSIILAKKNSAIPIIITHHKPFSKKTTLGVMDQLYETPLNKIIQKPIELWIYGHTHAKCDIKLNDVRIISNPKGYPYEHTKFDSRCVVDV